VSLEDANLNSLKKPINYLKGWVHHATSLSFCSYFIKEPFSPKVILLPGISNIAMSNKPEVYRYFTCKCPCRSSLARIWNGSKREVLQCTECPSLTMIQPSPWQLQALSLKGQLFSMWEAHKIVSAMSTVIEKRNICKLQVCLTWQC